MNLNLKYLVAERGEVRAGVFQGEEILKESGQKIVLEIVSEQGNLIRKEDFTGKDGWAEFEFNLLEFLEGSISSFYLRFKADVRGKAIKNCPLHPYLPAILTPVDIDENLSEPKNSVSLYGKWRYQKWPFSEEECLRKEFPDRQWKEVEVPGPVYLRSPFDSPNKMRDEITLSHIDPEDGFFLRRWFTFSPSKGKDAILRVDGIYPGGKIWINGKKSGEVWSGLTSREFDVTPFCSQGESLIAIRIYRKHPFVRLDMPRWVMDFCGIHRPIYIHQVPLFRILNCRLTSAWDKKNKQGILSGAVRLINKREKRVCGKIKVEICDGPNSIFLRELPEVTIEKSGVSNQEFSFEVPGVIPWSAEKPCLYQIFLRLFAEGKKEESVSESVGFRRFEVENGRPLLNGQAIKIRGINRLEFHPEKGLSQDEEWLKQEIFMIKRANINGVRTHLNPTHRFVELCDRMGLYLVQEIPIDWSPDLISEVDNLPIFLHRIQAAIQRDINDPSVLVWSIGNENLPRPRKADTPLWNQGEEVSFWRHSRIFHQWAKMLAPDRFTMFPPPGPLTTFPAYLQAGIGDVADIHYTFLPIKEWKKKGKITIYTTWEKKKSCTPEDLKQRGWKGIWFSSEYFCFGTVPELLEAPYLSLIEEERPEERFQKHDTWSVFKKRLQREWSYMEQDPASLGGAFFHFKDPAVGKPYQWTSYDEGLPWGIVTPYLVPLPFYWIVRSIFAPIQVEQRLHTISEVKNAPVKVRNLFSFTNLSEGKTFVQESCGAANLGTTSEWKEAKFDIPPLKARIIKIALSKKMQEALKKGEPGLIRLTFTDPEGYLITTTDTLLVPRNMKKIKGVKGGDFVLSGGENGKK
ncbi:MAG: glycoside hydrolase family 2 TIM barrel-domain containing protein [Candidatus Omnitrophota bacterium]